MESVEKRTKVLTLKEDFLSQVDPKTLGCIWVTDGALEDREKPFGWFDYLLDGILEKHILEAPKSPKSFFTANQFDRHFYVLQVEKSFPSLNQAFEEAFMLMKRNENQKKILCLSQNPQVFSVASLKKQTDLEFKNLIY